MMGDNFAPLGGYFEMELASQYGLPHGNQPSYYYQSARAAFRALLEVVKPARVWLPFYICDSMISSVADQGLSVKFYSQTDLLDFDLPEVNSNDVVLIVNYFGLHDDKIKKKLEIINRYQVVVDNSQALFSPPVDCLATIYSPRKFLGVPDGGILVTTCAMECKEKIVESDSESLSRSGYLLKRLALGAEAGYLDYQAAENSLADTTPKPMSGLTKVLLCSIDRNNVSERRRENYLYLSDSIDAFNQKPIELKENAVPLCYPLTVDDNTLRRTLIENKIFVATYWPDVSSRVSPDSAEARFVDTILPIPIDQRYSPKSLRRIVEMLTSLS